MKRRAFYKIALLAFASVGFLSSCTDETDTTAPTGSITFDPSTASAETAPGSSVNFKVVVTSPEKLDKVQIRFQLPGSSSYVTLNEYPDKTTDFLSSTSDNFDFAYSIPGNTPAGSTVKIKFIVVDTKSSTLDIEKEFVVTVKGSAAYTGKRLYNPAAPTGSFGAYDLVSDQGVAASEGDANKDMINTTVASNGGYPFVKGWKAENGTTFVKATSSFDYNAANKTSMMAAYAASTSVATVSDVKVNDVYIVKLRNGDNYVAVKVTQIVDDSKVGAGYNNDYIQFDYKK